MIGLITLAGTAEGARAVSAEVAAAMAADAASPAPAKASIVETKQAALAIGARWSPCVTWTLSASSSQTRRQACGRWTSSSTLRPGLPKGPTLSRSSPGPWSSFTSARAATARSVQPGSGSPRSSTRSGWAAEGRGALSARRRSRPPCCRGVTRSARAWPAVQAALRMAVAPCPAVSKRAPSACAPEAWPLGLR